jgi:glycosyl-4,4'-diaponeurosporenoate acyltransferase
VWIVSMLDSLRIVDPGLWQGIVLNSVVWMLTHYLAGQVITLTSYRIHNPGRFPYRTMPCETESLYRRLFLITLWKRFLPEGSVIFFGGFNLKKVESMAESGKIERYMRESCKAELIHLLDLGLIPLTLFFNYWWGHIIVVVALTAVNIPCILSQRYNRLRLQRYRQLLIKKGR